MESRDGDLFLLFSVYLWVKAFPLFSKGGADKPLRGREEREAALNLWCDRAHPETERKKLQRDAECCSVSRGRLASSLWTELRPVIQMSPHFYTYLPVQKAARPHVFVQHGPASRVGLYTYQQIQVYLPCRLQVHGYKEGGRGREDTALFPSAREGRAWLARSICRVLAASVHREVSLSL